MDDETLARALPQLTELWGITDARVQPLGGGMNSATALVETSGGRYVAKWSSDVESLEAGCVSAAAIGAHGVRTGEPVSPQAGGLVTAVAGGALALLRHVPGRELTGETPAEQHLVGATLAHAHTAGPPELSTGAFMSEWLSPPEHVLDVASWLPTALRDVASEYDELPALTWTQLHTDPTPGAFIHDDDTDTTGLIDWTGSCRGPALYDVASVVMYLGGRDRSERFLSSYAATGPLEKPELAWLDSFRRFRWAIQASYFASRIVADDQTGIADDPEHNRTGLARARRGLEETGSPRPVR